MPQNLSNGFDTRPESKPEKESGLVLCLSGGGFRATLFHVGALRRLNELGVLSRLSVFSSVSGGSILNGLLALRWPNLQYQPDGTLDRFNEEVADPIRAFCMRDLRTDLLLGVRSNPFNWPRLFSDFLSVRANFLASAYERLYDDARLSSLAPPQEGKMPRFVFCSTNVNTGSCWHFHSGPSGRMGDFYTGYMKTGRTTIAQAVAASSAFPPGFGALRFPIEFPDVFDRIDPWGDERPLSKKRSDLPLQEKRSILLADGGVYDNLGVEPIWRKFRSLLVSDAGLPFASKANCRQSVVPRLARAAAISMDQVGGVRKRWLIERIERKERKGALWAIDTPIEDYPIPDPRGYGYTARQLLASVRTDLNAFTDGEINCIENHGYSLADAAMRSRGRSLCPRPEARFQFPYPDFANDSVCEQVLCGSARRHIFRNVCKYIIDRVDEDWVRPFRRLVGY